MITEKLLKTICDGGLDELRDQLVAELRQVNNEKRMRKYGFENEKDCGCKEHKQKGLDPELVDYVHELAKGNKEEWKNNV